MKKVLVTGGEGFIGSHLVRFLLNNGVDAKVYDNLSSGSWKNLASIQSEIEVIESDVRNFDALVVAMEGVDSIFHLAALVSVPKSVNNPRLTYEINAEGTLNVLSAALKSDVSRVVISSSCAVYGDRNQPPLKETDLPMPKSPYAASKLTAEAWAESFYQSYGLETVCLRYFNVYGPGQKSDSDYAAVIPKFLDCYHRQQRPKVYGDGLQTRDFIYVEDVAKANFLASTASSEIIANHRAFNVGTGKGLSLLKLLEAIAIQIGYEIQPEFHPPRVGDIRHSWSDASLVKNELGFEPKINIDLGIKKLLSKN
ncbi:NAD-dependent epimerase/dehydratase family protein [Okeania sp. KiyG1]|uniref:NAD-dependent epimerase/dehydratase family protein n=1 Tax=Okeania sp. KiyG1 TaxID=2720165 RepID=UPI0019226B8F|nr:NAD-dependent epimerase/dehydratase family protein [Okeania sp. KiyG1]GGA48377.1 UDP-glucose 4-epimerase-like protein [Okeania sp. KiyG1]